MPLPPLPFGAVEAYSSSHFNEFIDNLAAGIPNLLSLDQVGDSGRFRYQTAHVTIHDTYLIASASSPIQYRVADAGGIYLWVPFHGHSTVKVDGYRLSHDPLTDIFLTPNCARSGANTTVSMLHTLLQRERLMDTARILLGDQAADALRLRLDQPQTLSSRQGPVNFKRVFWGVCQLIDDLHLDASLLALQGIDDRLYRTVVMLLLPEYTPQTGNLGLTPNATALDRVCDHIQANLAQPITLTQLEQLSGLSSRHLRHAFRKRFQCSPLQWLQQHRLELAHQRLSQANPTDTVAGIARACGISRLATFEPAYLRRYGEHPSATLSHALMR